MTATISRVAAAELATMLGGWATAHGPLHRRLARALRTLIELGQLPPAARLPSERTLARALLVSRTTVTAAYDALRREGLVSSRAGSGTSLESAGAPNGNPSAFPWTHILAPGQGETALGRDVVDLTASTFSSLPLVQQVLDDFTWHDWQRLTSLRDYAPLGLPAVRAALAENLSRRGLPASHDRLVITTGAQQGLHLITALLVAPGDLVGVEEPTYPGVLPLLRAAGARLRTIAVDAQGARFNEIERVVNNESVKLILLSPTYQNPTGTLLSRLRRERLAQLVASRELVVVDNMALADLGLNDHAAPAPLAAFGASERVLSLGSLTPLYWTGLRIGWISGPKQLIGQLARLKAAVDLGTPLIDQLLAARLLERYDEAVAQRTAQLREGHGLVTALLARRLPGWSWQPPAGGPSLWVRLPSGTSTEFAQVALRHGVAVLPGSAFSADGAQPDCLRVPFVLEPEQLRAAINRLATAWQEYARAG